MFGGARRKAIHREIKGSDKANGAHAANAAMGRASGIDTLDGRDANEKSSLAFSSEVAKATGLTPRTIQIEITARTLTDGAGAFLPGYHWDACA
jgi:hypothetical protein